MTLSEGIPVGESIPSLDDGWIEELIEVALDESTEAKMETEDIEDMFDKMRKNYGD